MKDTRRLELLESIAVIAQDSAEHGQIDSSIYADVFEFIAESLHTMTMKARCAV